jgi:hypothetical protein
MSALELLKDDALDGFVAIATMASALCGQYNVADQAGTIISAGATLTGLPWSVLRQPKSWKKGPAASLPANQYFADFGHDGAESPLTNEYLYHRSLKSFGGSVAGIIGGVVQPLAHGVDPISTAVHATSAANTSIHLLMLKKIADKSKNSTKLSHSLDLIIRIKSIKLAARTVSLAAAVIPFAPAQTAGGVLGAVIGQGVKLTTGQAYQLCAMEIHWQAFREQAVSGGKKLGTGGNVGPASQIVWELFNRRSYGRLLGKYDVGTIVSEPAGFMAIADKIMLL